MKNIKNYNAEKYVNKSKGAMYTQVEDGIYETGTGKNKLFVTSMSFEQEPKLGEGDSAESISQYPLEDILDKFFCHVSDFYEVLNTKKSKTCYLEFASDDIEDVKKLRSIIGKHVFNREVNHGDSTTVELVIE